MNILKTKLFLLFAVLHSIGQGQSFQTYYQSVNGRVDSSIVFCGVKQEYSECLSDADRQNISRKINENKSQLKNNTFYKKSNHMLFSWPLKWAPGISDFNFYTLIQYVNHDTINIGTPLDYNCGNRSYYNAPTHQFHKGTDIGLWPFMWIKMDNMDVQVIAAAPGIIIYKNDGNFDRSCSIIVRGMLYIFSIRMVQ
jgi:hypothetical protein